MRRLGRPMVSLALLLGLGGVSGVVFAAQFGVEPGIVNLGGGARGAGGLTISNDALGDVATGAAASASGRFRLEPYGAGTKPILPVAEIEGLHLDGPALESTVSWTPDPEADSYHLYRALAPTPLDPPPPVFDAYACDLADPGYSEWDVPQPGEYYAYLVTGVNAYYESGLGSASDGSPRVLGTPCP